MPTRDADSSGREEPSPSGEHGEAMIVFEFTVPAEGFALEGVLRKFPGVVVEYERLVPTGHSPLSYLWASDGAAPRFGAALEADPRIESAAQVATSEGGSLYYADWTPNSDGLLGCVVNTGPGIALLQARGREGEWTLKLRFPSRDALRDSQAVCEECGTDLRVDRLYDLTEPKLGQYDVTPKQREALLRALEMGYFEIPREITLEAVAESLGISRMATSERLRRGERNLLSNSLAIGHPAGVGIPEREPPS